MTREEFQKELDRVHVDYYAFDTNYQKLIDAHKTSAEKYENESAQWDEYEDGQGGYVQYFNEDEGDPE